MLAAIALLASAPVPLTCGAVIRPGIAERGQDGVWRGTAVEVCRRVAAQGRAGTRLVFHSYDSLPALRSARNDRLAFLSADELAQAGLHRGPAVAVSRQVLVVRSQSPLRASRDLANRTVCFIIGTNAESALNGWSAEKRVMINRLPFQEPVEMRDAFDAGECAAMAIDEAELGQERGMRPLAPALSKVAIFTAWPKDSDPQLQRSVNFAVRGGQRSPD